MILYVIAQIIENSLILEEEGVNIEMILSSLPYINHKNTHKLICGH